MVKGESYIVKTEMYKVKYCNQISLKWKNIITIEI